MVINNNLHMLNYWEMMYIKWQFFNFIVLKFPKLKIYNINFRQLFIEYKVIINNNNIINIYIEI